MKTLILASASPRRKMLLEQIGISPEILPSMQEESASASGPEELVCELAKQKCEDVVRQFREEGRRTEDCVFLGADTIVYGNGTVLGKPKDESDAADMLRALQGTTHRVYTGVCLIRPSEGTSEEQQLFAVCTEVDVSPMDEAEITAYLATGEPMDKAGAYAIQGIFARHIRAVRGSYSNVVGLPQEEVYTALKKLGFYKE